MAAPAAGPSNALEAEVATKPISPDAFEAVGGDNITPLFPRFTTWYVQDATTSIVLADIPGATAIRPIGAPRWQWPGCPQVSPVSATRADRACASSARITVRRAAAYWTGS
jgi:hypothetical protein